MSSLHETRGKLLRFRWHVAATALETSLASLTRSLKAGFDPNQPRVPAGNPDGGQWTRVEEQEGRVRLAQGDRLQGYQIDLREEERLGGHPISRHVGKSDAFLKARVQDEARKAIERGDLFDGISVGSFLSLDAATRLVNAALARNPDQVARVANGEESPIIINVRFRSATGKEAYLRTFHARPVMRSTSGVRVLLVYDPRVSKGFRVQSAFPIR